MRILSTHNDLEAGFDENIRINNDDIIGIVKIKPMLLNMYEIDNYYLSEKILILENGKWVEQPIIPELITLGDYAILIVYITSQKVKKYI